MCHRGHLAPLGADAPRCFPFLNLLARAQADQSGLSLPLVGMNLFWAGSSDIFYFCPSSKGRGGGQRGGGISLKSEEKGGKKGRGRRGRCRKRVGGIFWGGSLIFILGVEEPP